MPSASATGHDPAPRLRGDLAMWALIGIEMATFGLLFVAYAIARSREPEVFQRGQALLDAAGGARNTAWLLTGSWCVARGVHAIRAQALRAGAGWTAASAGCGMVFLTAKALEYRRLWAGGADLDTDTFHTFYFVLTGFHAMHVAAAVLALGVVAWRAPHSAWGRHDAHAPETVAAFWHMVDLLWVVLFPLVYLLR